MFVLATFKHQSKTQRKNIFEKNNQHLQMTKKHPQFGKWLKLTRVTPLEIHILERAHAM